MRDAGIRGEARAQRRHRVERLERGGVAAELDERVARDAVVERRRRRDRVRLAAEHERLGEAVARERERAEAARREEVVAARAGARGAGPAPTSCSRRGRRSRGRAAGRRGRAGRATATSSGLARSAAWSFATVAMVLLPPAEKPAASWPLAAAGTTAGLGVAAELSWKTPPSRSAIAVRLAAAAPSISLVRLTLLLLVGRGAGGASGRAPLPLVAVERLGHLVALVGRRDVRERAARAARRSRRRRRRAGCSGSCSAARTRRSGTCRSPGAMARSSMSTTSSPSRRPFGKPQRSASSTASRSGAAADAVPPGHAPLTPGLIAVFRRSRSDWVVPVKFSPGTPVRRISDEVGAAGLVDRCSAPPT